MFFICLITFCSFFVSFPLQARRFLLRMFVDLGRVVRVPLLLLILGLVLLLPPGGKGHGDKRASSPLRSRDASSGHSASPPSTGGSGSKRPQDASSDFPHLG